MRRIVLLVLLLMGTLGSEGRQVHHHQTPRTWIQTQDSDGGQEIIESLHQFYNLLQQPTTKSNTTDWETDPDEPECKILPPYQPPINDLDNLSLWQLLQRSREQLTLSDSIKDVILLLGNTGSGKTTVTQIVAGDPSALEVVKTNDKASYIVIDPEEKIGRTTASRTLVPELVTDAKANLAIYDCPGFSDNRGSDIDITINYLLNTVTNHVNSVKLAFTVIHSAVYGTNDKTNFDQLATHAVKMMGNLEKFKDSFALVVTKAPHVNQKGKAMSEAIILNGVKGFLLDYKGTQEGLFNDLRTTDRELIRKKIEFVEMLLQDQRIAIIRLAVECGKISEDEDMMASRDHVRDLFLHEMKPAVVTPEDFGYALMDSSLRKIDDYVKEIQGNFSTITGRIVSGLQKDLMHKEDDIGDFRDVQQFLTDEYSFFYMTAKGIKSNGKSSRPFIELEEVFKQRNYSVDAGLGKELNQLEDYLEFFARMDPDKAGNFLGFDRLENLNDWITNNLGKRREWFDFLVRTKKQFSNYQFQINRPVIEMLPGQIDFNFLTKKLGLELDQRVKDLLDDSILFESDRAILRTLVSQALEPIRKECKEDEMSVYGTYVKASDFADNEGGYKCAGARKTQIFATEVFFMDQSLTPDKNLTQELTIIAPLWDVAATTGVEINLSGRNGDKALPKAENGKTDGANGRAGLPGAAGTSGGYFYGLAERVNGAERLKVKANGGEGGQGQEGGNGHEGAKGRDVPYSEWPSCYKVSWEWTTNIKGWEYFEEHYERSGIEKGFAWDCIKYGDPGKRGGNGGAGGAAGEGGFPGKVELTELNGDESVHVEMEKGSWGSPAEGGDAGIGGKRGVGKKAIMATTGVICGYRDINDFVKDDRGPAGDTGVKGGNNNPPIKPKENEYTQDKNHWEVINNFKALAFSFEGLGVRNKLLELLDANKEIQTLYTTTAFSHELLNMENFALTMKPGEAHRLRPNYERFMARLDAYAKSRNHSKEDKKVLSILYTTAMSTTLSTLEKLRPSVVVNVEGYMDTVLQRFQRYTQLETKVLVDEQRTSYAATFTKKIEQALAFITDTVNPEMNRLAVEQTRITEDLGSALTLLKDATTDRVSALKAAERQMKETMLYRKILSGLKIGGQIISMFGAHGAVIGGIIGGGASVAEQFGLGDYSKDRTHLELPSSVKDYAKNLEEAAKPGLEKKLKDTKALVDEAEKALEKNKEEIGDIKGKVKELRDKREAIGEAFYNRTMTKEEALRNFKELNEKEKELKKSLSDKNMEFDKTEKSKSASEAQKTRAKIGKKILSKLTDLVSIAETSFEVYNKIKDDDAQLEEISGLVKEAEDAVKNITAKEGAISDSLIPYTASVNQDLENLVNGLTGQSSVSLLVKRWAVKKQLANYRDFLEDFTAGFGAVSKKIGKAVKEQTEAMNLLIDLYDYIEKYTEHMQFADYIANIQSPAAAGIKTSDPYIPGILLALQANILLGEYDQSIKAFQQWVFPFGALFEEEAALSPSVPDYLRKSNASSLTPNDVTQYLVPRLIEEVENLKIRLAQYKSASFEGMDVRLIETKFNSVGKSTQPFFVWGAEEKEVIKDLLSGKKVTLWADSMYAYSAGRAAVKFRVAEIQPKSRNKKVQEKLTEMLNEFGVIMTHSGASHYMYAAESVVMVGDNATLRYNFERDPGTGERTGRNTVYMKVQEGNYILSPYTLWTVQLIKATRDGEGKYGFADLAAIADDVEIELIGEGIYVDEKDYTAAKKHMLIGLYDFDELAY